MSLPRGAFRDVADNSNYESHLTYTAQSDLAAGTVLTESDFGSLQLSNSADQILVYTGSKTSPTFLSALDNSKGHSELPPVCTTATRQRPEPSPSTIRSAASHSVPRAESCGRG